jgi:hypothetical protein
MVNFRLCNEQGLIVATFFDWDAGIAEGSKLIAELTRSGKIGKFELRDPSGKKPTHHFEIRVTAPSKGGG